ncbi:PorT family protein [Aquimarina sp. AD10]|uniref:porin family protein n=1 Tax=Aquimarina sp. AD10 TaxID=1714849 RepID=UPI000E511DAB|nr:porin family protein [Aquimarina sp. AD10]AXT59400.1 PorT family protein [Aquimarina sp. AD10]RKM92375.1 PorT family protein [Aquimarina sp. AD10]
MKRVFLLTLAIISFTFNSQAQDIKFGFKGGINLATINGNDVGDQIDGRTGFHLGTVLQLSILETFVIQPELLYSAQGTDDIDLDYINIPVLAKLKFAKFFSVETGPQFGFIVNDGFKNATEGLQDVSFLEAETFDFGFAFGGSVEYNDFFMQARYNLGLTEIINGRDGKNSNFQISVGFYIF